MPRLFLFSSVPGTNIDKSINGLLKLAADKGVNCSYLKYEISLIEAGSELLKGMGVRPNKGDCYSLAQILTLPYLQLSDTCTKAFGLVIDKVIKTKTQPDAVFISFHPVYYHQQTLEFNSAIITSEIIKILKKSKMNVEYLVSVHDDVYDIYKFLISEGQLLNPLLVEEDLIKGKRERNPNKDIFDLLFILKWRDHELTSSMNKAKSLNARHLLFHNKGRISSLWRIIWEHSLHTYYSHPIAQPRRDINKQDDPPKSNKYDVKRGESLILEIQETANNITRFCPIIEPTSIDELRLDLCKLNAYKISDLQTKLLPPLYKRWPFGSEDRLADKHESEVDKNFVEIGPEIYPSDKFTFKDDNLEPYRSALEILRDEIKRQINVRDHVLAYQADRIIAFRPYSLPDYPKATGGVLEEIESLIRKIKLGRIKTKPALIIVHPKEDEKRRKRNEFLLAWVDKLETMVIGSPDKKESLKGFILNEISDLTKSSSNLETTIIRELALRNINIKKQYLTSSMESTTLLQQEELRRTFADEVLDKTLIMKSALKRFAETYPDQIKIIENYNDAEDLYKKIVFQINC